jgi:hypothetical protein
MEPNAADEAGIFIALGRMADQSGGFVQDQQLLVLKNGVKQWLQPAQRAGSDAC